MQQYFWLFTGIWPGLVGAVYLRFRLRSSIESGKFTKQEVDSFTRGLGLWVFLPCFALWLLQRSVGSDAPFEYTRWPNPQKLIALALQLFVWAALLYWIFVRSGADMLIKINQATRSPMRSISNPVFVKIFAVVAVITGLITILIQ